MDTFIGLGACLISTVCFGSMYVAVRKFDSGDGIFVQWIVCIGIFIVGIIINMVEGIPQFEPLAMLGGVLWAVGNVMALPIIKTIGLAMGLLLWGTTNCVIGWATGRFGLFGLHANIPVDPLLNYIGLAFILIGGVLFALIKPTAYSSKNNSCEIGNEHSGLVYNNEPRQISVTINSSNSNNLSGSGVTTELIDSHSTASTKSRILAVSASLLAGCCYGVNFVPIIYIQEHPDEFFNPPSEEIKYAFSHFTGIFLCSTFIFVVYLAYTRNRPVINSKIISPSLLAGFLWAIAQLAWFVSNDKLSQAITFPIDGMMPGVCASLWSVFFFKEIKGSKNLRILTVAIALTLTGAILVGVSKAY